MYKEVVLFQVVTPSSGVCGMHFKRGIFQLKFTIKNNKSLKFKAIIRSIKVIKIDGSTRMKLFAFIIDCLTKNIKFYLDYNPIEYVKGS